MKNRKNRKAELPAVFEPLEPRLLFSAGLESALAADQPAAPTEIYKQTVLQQSLETGRAESRDTRTEETRVEIIFVDTDTPRYQSLLSDLLKYPDDTTSFEVFELDNTRDGLEQITSVLDGRDNVNAVHILSHGSEGAIDLGGSTLDHQSLATGEEQVRSWSHAFADGGDILIYGCNLAADDSGEQLVNRLAEITGADVAASDDLTGSTVLGGDWDLEYHVGHIHAALSAAHDGDNSWSGTLDTGEAMVNSLTTPLAFEANVGQTDTVVDYMARGSGYTVFLTEADAVISLATEDGGHAIRLDLVGGNASAAVAGEDTLDSYTNYLIGDDPSNWKTNVANQASVLYTGVYEGIDVRYYGNQRQFEYDFVVAAGADTGQIKIDFQGIASFNIADNGDLQLVLNEDGQQVTFMAPVSFQYAEDGSREAVKSEYQLHEDGTLGFTLGDYDASRTLVIDPILSWASYFGGTGNEDAFSIAVDAAGDIIIAGDTNGTTLPITTGPFGPTGAQDAFVAKFSNDGSSLLYSTYFGGSIMDRSEDMTVDSAGNIYVVGETASGDFPIINGNDTTINGVDGFLAKFNAAGTAITYSTYLGGSGNNDQINAIALDPSGAGRVVVAGDTDSSDLPTSNAYDATSGGSSDGMIAAYDTTQTGAASLLYSSYFGGSNGGGGSGDDSIRDLDFDAAGNLYLAGNTSSTSQFPLSANAFDATVPTSTDAFVAKIKWNGGASWSTLYGSFLGSDVPGSYETAEGITTDAAGNIYITGWLDNSGFITKNAYDSTFNGVRDAFIAKFDPNAALAADTLVYSTYFGGSGFDAARDIKVDSSGGVYVLGDTGSADLPLTADAHDSLLGGSYDAMLVALDASGNTLEYSTYLGGNNNETGRALTFDANENIYILGRTSSTTGLATPGAYDTTYNGASDAFVVKMIANQDPVATDNVYTTNEGTAVSGNVISDDTGAGVDSDPDLDPLTASLIDGPLHGTLVLNPDGSFTYTPFDAPTTNFADIDTFTYQVNDGKGGTDNATVTITITPDAVNEAPVNQVPGAQTTGQDVPLVFSEINGNSIIVRDDAGGNAIEVTLTATNGIVTLAGTTGLAITGGGDGTATVTVQGTITDLNNALDGMSFTPTLAYLGSATLQIDTNDLGNAPVAAPQVDTDIININVQAANDAPVNSVPGAQNFDQDGMLLFSTLTGTAISVSDVDAFGNLLEVTLTATNGTLNLSGNNGLTFTTGDGTADATMVFTGTITDINTALEGATFVATAGYTGAASVQIHTDDQGNTGSGGAKTDTDTVNITVDPAEQKLWFTFENDENDTGISEIPSVTGGDVVTFGGDMTFEPGTTSGTFSYEFNLDTIAGTDGNTRVNAVHYVSSDMQVGTNSIQLYIGDLLLSTDQKENINGVDYEKEDVFVFRPTTAGDYSAGSFFKLIDGKDDMGWGNVTAITLVEKTTVVGTGAGAITLNAGEFLISNSDDAKDIQHFIAGTLGDTTTGTLTTLIDGADIDIDKGVAGIHLVQTDTEIGDFTLSAGQMLLSLDGEDTTTGDAPTISTLRQDVFVLDVTSVGPGTTAATATAFFEGLDVNINENQESISGISYQGNAAPTIADATFNVDENVPTATLVDTVTASDPEGNPINYAITAGNTNGAFVIDAISGDITVGNSAMLDFETTPVFILTIAAIDDKGAYNTATFTINLNDVNDRPIVSDVSISATEDGGGVIGSYAVYDQDTADTHTFNVTAGPSEGSVVDNNDGTFTFNPGSDFQDLAEGETRDVTFTYTATDNSGAANATSTAATVTVTVTGVNDRPVVSNVAVSATEDGSTVSGNFAVSDADSGSNHTFNITGSPSEGSVVNNNDGTFTFNPGGDFQDLADGETRDVTFTYTATDDSGTGNDTSTAATVTVTVTGTNDQPSASNVAIAATEDGATVNGSFVATDADTTDAHTFTITGSPSEGSVVNNNDGTFTYNPGGDFQDLADGETRDVTFTYTATDDSGTGNDTSMAATVTVTVTGTNDQPTVSNVAVAATEDGATVNGSFVVTDADTTDAHTFAITGSPSEGSVVNNNDGTFTFNPGSDFQDLADGETRDVTFTYTATDDSGTANDTSTAATVTVTVTGTNDQPAVSNVAVAATEDGATVNGSFVVTDIDTTDGHSFTITGTPSEGSVVNNNDGTFTFNPDSDFQDLADGETRDVTFTYTATDDSGTANATSTAATVTVTVTGTNDQPSASNVAIAATEDGATVNGSFVATDADTTDAHTFTITGSPSEGSVVNNNDGTFTFNPGSDFQDLADGETRDVTFTYTATDDSGTGNDTSTAATVTVTVTGTNDQPSASNVAIAATEDGATVNGSFVATDADTTDAHTFTITGSPSEGSVVNNNDGTFTFNPGSDFQDLADGETRDVTFTYTATDDSGTANATSTAATVTVTVTGTNDQPSASNVAIAATEDGTTVNGSFVATDADTTDAHTFTITGSPSEGSVVNNNDGTFTFNPGSDFQDLADGETRDVTFTYTATDDSGTGNDTSTAATVTVTVTGTNDQPAVSNVAVAATEDGATVNGSFVVADADTTDGHSFTITGTPSEGSVVNNNDGTFTFNPDGDFQDLADGETRDVTFTYTATDDSGTANATSTAATVTVTVTGTNDQPSASNVAIAATEDGATVNGSFVATDADTTDAHTFAITGSPSEGSVVNNNDGTFTFNPGSDFQDLADGETRDVTFTYTATDDSGTANDTSTAATVTVTVTGTNDQPAVSNVAVAATEDGATVNGSFVVADADTTDGHSFAITSSPSEGSVVNNNDGTFTYNPGAAFQDLADGETRDVTFTYTATDDSGTANDTSTAATVTVTVTGTNDQPAVSNVAVAATEDGATVNGSFVVTDADTTDGHSFTITGTPSEGSVVNNNDGTFTFDPGTAFQDLADGETRDVTFTYTATDDSGTANNTSTAATVTVTVTGTNDQPAVSNVAVAATEDGATVSGSFVVTDVDTTDGHSFTITGTPSEGSVVNNNDGTFTFDPGAAFQDLADGETRDVTFTYTAIDDSGTANDTSTAATVTVTVTGTNDQPAVSNVAVAATEDGATVNGSFVVTDADTTDGHSFTITGTPSEGTVANNNDGTFTFDPGVAFQDLADGETRDVTFTYTATDDSGTANDTSTAATVTVTVTGTNDQPTVSNVAVAATEDGATVNGNFVAADADTTDGHSFTITSSPSEGSVVNNNDGTFTFNPGAAFQDLADGETRDVTFNYTATDDSGTANATSTAATVTVTVTGTNDQPTVSDVTASTNESNTVNGNFNAADTDTTDTHTFNITSLPSEGTVVNNNDGTFTFDPDGDFDDLGLGDTRDVTFAYTATDNSGTANATSTSATVTITVGGGNAQPVVSNVSINADEDGAAVNGNFVVTDIDSADTHTFTIIGSPSEGSVVNNNNGTFTFDPGSDFQDLADGETRDVTFTYIATDNSGAANDTSAPATVTVTVTGTNDQPAVSSVAVAATEDGATVNGSFVVTDDDTTDAHTFTIIGSPSEGSVVNNNNGTFTFDPGSDFQDLADGETRNVTFTYTATDDSGTANDTSAPAIVTVTVTGTNDQPTVSNVAVAATEDGSTVNGSFVVADADATDAHTFTIIGSPSEGSVVNNNNGTFTFNPGSDFQDLADGETRNVTFTYTATDDSGTVNDTSAPATVTVTVTGTNDQPTVSNVAVAATEDGATVNGSFVVADDDTTDTHTFTIIGSPSEGSAVNNNDGTFTFNPGSDFQDLADGETRNVTFTYTATDDSGTVNDTSAPAIVTVTVTGTNDQPTVSAVAVAATEDGSTVNGSFVVADADTTDAHTFTIIGSPSEGSVVNNNNGTFTFNPGADFQDLSDGETRDVTFTYTATDDSGTANATSTAATVTVTVTGTNDQPTVSDVAVAATEDGSTVNGSFVVADDDTTDTHTFTIIGSPSEGSVVNNNDGTFTFNPGSDFQDLADGETRNVTFTYTATDDSGTANDTSAPAIVTVTVTGTNDQPTVSAVAVAATEDGATVNGSFVVADADTTDAHTFTIIGSPSEGSVVNNNDGTFTFNPGSDFQDLADGETRNVTFTYTATDDSGTVNDTSALAIVTVTVTGTNDQPTVSAVAVAATEDGATVNGSFVVADADTTDAHTFTITGSPSEGSVVNNNNGTFTFNPGADFQDLSDGETRDVTFTYTATDDSGTVNDTSVPAIVTVTVTGTNDQPTVSAVAVAATEDGATVNGSFVVADDDTTDAHTFTIIGSPSEGSVVNNNDGTFTFNPGSDFQDLADGETRNVTFTYTATDDSGTANDTSAPAIVTVTVTGTNDQPTVSAVAVAATEDGTTVNGSFVVADADTTDAHTFTIIGSPSEGSVVNNNDGTFTFDPGSDFQDLADGETRDVTFTYTATDDSGTANDTSAPATVTVTVTGTNDQPTVSNVAIAATEDGSTVNGSFVVADADTTDAHTFTIIGSPSEGSVVNNNNGTFTFDPGSDFQDLADGETRVVTFTYTAMDDSGAANDTSAPAIVTVTVTGTNDQPTVSNVAVAATEDGSTVNGSFVVADDDTTDAHTFTITGSPSEGSVVNNNDGTFTFNPDSDFQDLADGETRDVTFTYTATDDSGTANATSTAATVTVTVTGTNDQPMVSDVAVAATEDGSTVNGSFVMADADTTDAHSFTIIGSPSEGSVVNNNDGTFTFNPGSDFQDLADGETRDVTFTYTATDDSGTANATSTAATVTVTVTGTNDQPTVSDVAVAATEDGSTVNGSFVVADDDTTDTHTFTIIGSPSEGSVVNNNDGTFTFNPGSDFQDLADGETRDVTFTYTATDDSGTTNDTSAPATVTVTVTGTNDQPTVSAVAVAATEDGAIVNGSFVVADADTTDAHTFTIIGSPSEGSVVNNNDGTFTFNPGSDFQDLADGETRDVTFTYTAMDDSGTANDTSTPATVTVTVTGTNDQPTVSNVAIAATEDGATVNGSFVVADADTTDAHTFTITGSPSEGSVVNNNDGTFTFNPGSDFQDLADGETRDVSFTYTATDNSGTANDTSATAIVTVTVTGTNDQPTVSAVAVAATEDGSTVNGSFVVADADTTDAHTFTIIGSPSEGSVVNNNNGTFTFNPGADFQDLSDGETRDVTFTYTATDDSGTANDTSAPATVTVTITGTNDQPTVSNVAVAATEDGSTVNGSFVVSDDDTADAHTFTIIGSPSEGSVVNNNNGTFSFDPGSDFQDLADGETRIVTFTYTAMDDSGTANDTSTPATVTVTVTGTNDRPTVSNVAIAATEDGSTVNGNFSVADADTTDAHNFTIIGSPSEGSVVNNNNGTFTFNPGSDFQDLADGETRNVTFTYTATDDSGTANATSVPATVTVTVTGTNDQPTVSNVAVAATEDGSSVNGNFSVTDVDTTDGHTFTIIGSPSEGSVVNNNNGTFTFNPGADFQDLADGETRNVMFTYTAMDDSGTANDTSTPATVTVTVTGTNDQPTVSNVAVAATEDGGTVNGNFVTSDVDTTDAHNFTITNSPSQGSVINNNDGTFSFDPGSDFQDLDDGETRDVTFSYTSTDSSGAANATSMAAVVTVTVSGSNDTPIATNNHYNVDKDAAVSGNVLSDNTGAGTDSDIDGDALNASLVSGTSDGTLALNPDGSFTYTPDPGFVGSDSFTYHANDGTVTSGDATVSISVNGVKTPDVIDPETDPDPDPVNDPDPIPDDDKPEDIKPVHVPSDPVEILDYTNDIDFDQPAQSRSFLLENDNTATSNYTLYSELRQNIEVNKHEYPTSLELWQMIDIMKQQIEQSQYGDHGYMMLVAKSASGMALSLTAGVITWALRGGSLLASMMSSVPLWRGFDPLPIISGSRKDEEASDEPTDSLFEANNGVNTGDKQ